MGLPVEIQEKLMRITMRLAEEAATDKNLPFAALLVDESGNVILSAKNTVNSTHNAAAHAEINLLFLAAEKLKANDLSDYYIVSNAASCPMCATALVKAKITEFYYGASNEGTMVPDITMDEVIARVPFQIRVFGGILADECSQQIKRLANRL